MAQGQRLGEAAGFIELDVNEAIAADDGIKTVAVVAAFIGGQRHGTVQPLQLGVTAGRHRLFDQFDAKRCQLAKRAFDIGAAPGFIGIDDQPGIRRGAAHGGHALHVRLRATLTAQLDLQQLAAPHRACCCRHRRRISEADGVGGEHRLRHRQAERLPDAAAGLFGFQIPQRTIKRVARRTGGQQRQQIGTAGTRRHRAGTARQRRQGQFR